MHRHQLEHLVGFVHSGPSGELRSDKGVELINLPFDEEEESWFEEYLLTGKGRTLYGAKDTVIMRRIASGKMTETFHDSTGLSGRKLDGVNWDTLKDSIQRGAGPRISLLDLTSR